VATNADFNCTANQTFSLSGTFKTDSTQPLFIAMDVMLEIEQAGVTSMSPFYYYALAGAQNCNGTGRGISNDPDPAVLGKCAEPSFENLLGATVINGYGADNPRGGHGRFSISVFRQSNDPMALQANGSYFAFRLSFNSNNRGTCAGCGSPAAIVWNYATLRSSDGTSRVIEGPDRSARCATLNGGTGACAAATVNRTWGQLEALYR
jgi:hypothetical protein